MRIALSPTTPGLTAGDLVSLVGTAEELGYTEVWLAEVAGPEAFSFAGAIASATKRVDIGIAVIPAASRSAALLAMGAGTVGQLLGERRFMLGIGSSSRFIVRSWHDAPFDPPLRRVQETVQATRALLGGERDFQGDHVKVERFALTSPPPRPVSLFVGALGPGMLGVAGAVGDGVCLNLMPPSAVPRQRAAIIAGAEAAGRSLAEDFEVMARLHVVITDDASEGRAVVRQAFGPYFAQPVYNRFLRWLGHSEEADAIAAAFAAGDREGVAGGLTDEIVDEVALVGSIGRVRERLEEYAAAGLDVAALNVITTQPDEVSLVLKALLSP